MYSRSEGAQLEALELELELELELALALELELELELERQCRSGVDWRSGAGWQSQLEVGSRVVRRDCRDR